MANNGAQVARLRIKDLFITRNGSVPDKDSRMTNCMLEDVNGQPQVISRPGYGLTTSLGTGQGHGATVYTNGTTGAQKVYCVVGSSAYLAAGGTAPATVINGTFAVSTNELIDWTQYYNGTAVVLKCSSAAYTINAGTDVATKITSGSYPASTARGMVFLDGTFYVMDKNGTIYNSAINDPTTWTGDYISASVEPDGGMALAKSGQYVVAFGQYTTEFFYDAGNATGSPLAPVQNGTLMVGCANANSLAYGEGSFYMAVNAKAQGQATGFGTQIGKFTDLRYEKVSTDAIERVLNADGMAVCFGNVVSVLSHSFYTLSLPTSGITLALDLETKVWYVWKTGTSTGTKSITALTSATNVDGTTVTATATSASHGFADGDPITIAGANQAAYNGTFNITRVDADTFTYQVSSIPVTPATGTITGTGATAGYYPLIFAAAYGTSQIAQRVTDGYLCTLSDTTYSDAGIYVDVRARTVRIDNDKNQSKFQAWFDVITDRMNDTAMVRYSDDDYATYSKFRSVSLAGKRSRLNRQGRFLRRAYEVRYTGTQAFRLQGLDIALEEGVE